jgi:hypothetical protein
MPFEEDLTPFFSESDFAHAATFTPSGGSAVTVNGIFDAEYAAVEGDGQVAIASTMPVFQCRSVDAPDAYNATLVVAGATYRVVEVKPDGTGVTMLVLEDQS